MIVIRVLFNDSGSCLCVAECMRAWYSEDRKAFFLSLSESGHTELMNAHLSRSQADDLCRSALITGTIDLTPYGRTYHDYEYTKDGKIIGSDERGLW